MPPPQPQGPCKALAVLLDHAGSVSSLLLCGEFLLSASMGGDIVAWQQPDLRRFAWFGHSENGGSIKALVAAGGQVYAVGSDGHVAGWDRLGGRTAACWTLACDVKAHDMAVLCLCIVRDLLYTGSADKTIGLWRRQSGDELAKVGVIGGHEGPVKCIQASWCRLSNGCMVYSGSLDKTIRVWWVPGALQHDNGNEQQQQQEKSFKGSESE
ncbi:unnamed protein product [Miscanthus lutarioriparius]|uniref:Uncharacterized protein n=1 Tax=Miscanthus lutarioriparius TaxID=422564 RepID=A0A811PXX6_9POAL|nr:unnamed protein product [Miscanthus lutarioriparius]